MPHVSIRVKRNEEHAIGISAPGYQAITFVPKAQWDGATSQPITCTTTVARSSEWMTTTNSCRPTRNTAAARRINVFTHHHNVARRGFTLMESLVLLGIFVVLLSIFIPYGLDLRESNRRVACAVNLYQLRDAISMYVSTNGSYPRVVHDLNRPDGYAAYTGADDLDPFAAASAVSPNDVTASLWLLVRAGFITDLRAFVCPSSRDYPDRLTDAAGKTVPATRRSNFRSPRNLSYSYASPFSSAAGYRFNSDTAPAGFALLADRNPGVLVPADASPSELARGNSQNHRGALQNILFVPNYIASDLTPYAGVGRSKLEPGDNIYSARAAHPATQPTYMPIATTGFIGQTVSPTGNDDSYLVPTAADTAVLLLPPSTQPTSAPTTAP